MLLAVNYHYVQPQEVYPYPGIHPATVQQLKSQLTALGRHFVFVSAEAVLEAVRGGPSLPEYSCVVTFDDGLAEHHGSTAAVLDALGIRGAFFICTQPLLEQRALVVHKLHWLRATRPPQEFLSMAMKTASAFGMVFDPQQVDDAAAARQYLYDEPQTRRIKYWLNHMLAPGDLERLTEAMFKACCKEGEAVFCRRWYMSEAQITGLARRHTVGSHAHSHRPLGAMSRTQMKEELVSSKQALEKILGEAVPWISYPYGGPTAATQAVAEEAAAAGYAAGFTMERSLNMTLMQPLLLARLSANDAPGGSSPLLSMEAGVLQVKPPMTAARRRYFLEEAAAATVA